MPKRLLIFAITGLIAMLPLHGTTPQVRIRVENALIDIVKTAELLGPGMDADSRAKTIRDLETLRKVDPDNDAVLFNLGMHYAAAGKFNEAAESFGAAIAADPDNDNYREGLASVYSALGEHRKAEDIYLSLYDKSPGKYGTPYVLTAIAEKHIAANEDSLALSSYDQALSLDPEYAPALIGKAELNRIRGNLPAFFVAMTDFTSAKSIPAYPKSKYIKELLARVDGRTYHAWREQLDDIVDGGVLAHPGDSSMLKLAGGWFFGTGRKDKGRKYFDSYLEHYPDCLDAHLCRLQFLEMDKDYRAVQEECRAILNLNLDKKEKAVVLGALADCFYRFGDKKKAYSCYEKVLKLNPDEITVLNNYAYNLCLDGKRLGKAEKMSRKTLEKEPDNPTYLDTYGWILHLLGKDAEARPFFKHAMVYGGKENVEVLRHFSAVLEALGEKELSDYYKGLADSKE